MENIYLFGLLVLCSISVSYQQGGNKNPIFIQYDPDANPPIDGDLQRRLQNQGVYENIDPPFHIGDLKAIDPDCTGGPDACPLYYFTNMASTFKVYINGSVFLNKRLDAETTTTDEEGGTSLRVKFYVYDKFDGETITEIPVRVLDRNDNIPQFQNIPYRANIPEDASPGTTVFEGISVTDEDKNEYSRIEIHCSGHKPSAIEACEYFDVGYELKTEKNYRGFLTLKKQLDYETKTDFVVTVVTVDNPLKTGEDKTQNSGTANIMISVQDRQDSPPAFVVSPVAFFPHENFPLNGSIGSVLAFDQDVGNPREIGFRIVPGSGDTNLFKLGPSVLSTTPGQYQTSVLVNAPIDYEQGVRYEFRIEAYEIDENGQETNDKAQTKVTIDVLDRNDNKPTFDLPTYRITVPENQKVGSRIPADITCRDPDFTSNARFRVTMRAGSSDTFFISNEVYESRASIGIFVGEPLKMDYEKPNLREQTIELEAQPADFQEANPSITRVTIVLVDENDNSPIFGRPEYAFSVPENQAVGSTLFTDISATDADSDENGRITYEMRSNVFKIDPVNGKITLISALDFETISEYEFLVKASDNGAEHNDGYATLKIKVLDYNDLGPLFAPASYETQINEGDSVFIPGPPVQVKASDPETGLSDGITFRIVRQDPPNIQNPAFRIDRITGALSLSRDLVYAVDGPTITIFVEASDNDANNPQTSLTTITVTINDINDHAPEFTSPDYRATISELERPDHLVTQVAASDQDYGSNKIIRYSIGSGSLDHFYITPNNGSVHVKGSNKMDVDLKSDYEMLIYATDEGSPPQTGTATVFVTLTDANNKNPEFAKHVYFKTIKEGEPESTSVLTVSATDPDNGHSLRYSINKLSITARDGNGQILNNPFDYDWKEAFKIDPLTGVVSTNNVLSRRDAAWYDFPAIVTDVNGDSEREQTGTTLVSINILGSRESRPYFAPPWTLTDPEYRPTIREGTPKGVRIISLSAFDPGDNVRIKNFELAPDGPDNEYFTLDVITGDMFLAKQVDYEDLDVSTISATVIAKTNSVPVRTVAALITITVQDENDNSPVFKKEVYQFEIREDYGHPSQVGVIRAEDGDSGKFGLLEYSITGQGANDFKIFNDGVIIVNGQLDHETKPEYNLLVTAKDNRDGSDQEKHNQVTAPLNILVTDTNDHAPLFSENIYNLYTVESTPPSSSIGEINAVDLDSGSNAVINYYLSSSTERGSNLFSVGLSDGVIYTKTLLRGKSIGSPYDIIVSAQDQGFPVRSSTATVRVHISSGQLNDGTPVYNAPAIGHIVKDVCETIGEATGNESVYNVSADPRSENAQVRFSIMQGINNDKDFFDIKNVVVDAKNYGALTFKKGKVLDREVKETYEVLLVATDTTNATLKSYRQLTVKLCDRDDNIPSFVCNGIDQSAATVQVTEDILVGNSVYKVSACDGDLPPNNEIKYKLYINDAEDCPSVHADYLELDEDTGLISTKRKLDRETYEQHKLCIQAYTPADNRTGQDQMFSLTVVVIDRNDNAPEFNYEKDTDLLKVIFEFPDDDFIIQARAVDKDEPPYNRVRYLLSSINFWDPEEQEFIPIPGAFLIDPDKGIVTTGFKSYREFTNGYFNVKVRAEDYYKKTLSNDITIRVYVTQQRNRIRVVLRQAAQDAQADANQLLKEFNEQSDNSWYIKYAVTYHRTSDAEYDYTRTDVCFTILNRPSKNTEYSVLNSYQGTKIVEEFTTILETVESVDVGPCDPETTNTIEGWAALWWVLVAFAIFIFICTFIFIVVICHLHKNYSDFMESRKTYLVQN